MKSSILNKLESISDRLQELDALLADPDTINNQNRFRELSMEYSQITPIVSSFRQYQSAQDNIDAAREMMQDDDSEVREMAEEEIKVSQTQQAALEKEIQMLLLPVDPHDNANIFLEIRAGTGGDEAAIFAGDLFRMYSLYTEMNGWQIEIISCNNGEHGGYRVIISRITGKGVYSKLKFESGVHRVQRVPATESQGRIHTSACTVAILPEPDEIEQIEIKPSDLKIDTFRASGAGGQHVNKTDSAIRIAHLPSGIVIECQDERSQHKNRARAMSLLQAKLMAGLQEKQATETAQARKSLVGSGDRSERIRTYNFPQGRMTDHRINLTLYKLDEIMSGNLAQVVNPLVNEHQAEQLAALAE